MERGRPTDYSDKILKEAHQYLKDCEENDSMPQIAQLAYKLDVSRKTLYNWGVEYPDFLHILEKILSLQEFFLVAHGLRGDYNSTIAKLMLGKHGYKDNADVTSGGEKIAPMMVKFLDGNTDTK